MSPADSESGAPAGDEPAPSLYRRVRSAMGAVRRRLRSLGVRMRHGKRRRHAREALAALPPPRSVLFVCLGNVCRSPYAEARFRQMAPEGVRTASVGFIGPGRSPPEEALEVARQRGVDTGEHRSRVVTLGDVERADLIVLVDPAHGRQLRRRFRQASTPMVVLGDLDPRTPRTRSIPDPWGQPLDTFHEVFERIDRCIEELMRSSGLLHATRRTGSAPGPARGTTPTHPHDRA